MAYVIAEPCIDTKDGQCIEACPVDCIQSTEASNQYYINPEVCIDCGACLPECPVGAIFEDSLLPEEWKNFADINQAFFRSGVSR